MTATLVGDFCISHLLANLANAKVAGHFFKNHKKGVITTFLKCFCILKRFRHNS